MKNRNYISPFFVFLLSLIFLFCAMLVRDFILTRGNQTIVQINKRKHKRRRIRTLKGEYIIADTFVGKVSH